MDVPRPSRHRVLLVPGHAGTQIAGSKRSGTQLWVARYHPASSHERGSAVAVSPDGSRVFVAGQTCEGAVCDYATVAYDSVGGAKLWASRYSGPGHYSFVSAVAVSPDGSEASWRCRCATARSSSCHFDDSEERANRQVVGR